MKVNPEKFANSVKGKIIIAVVIACAALFLAWSTSKIVFREMLSTVDSISTPGQKLRYVHNLSVKIIALDQLQKSEASHSRTNFKRYLEKSKQLNLSLDTLKSLYANDENQLQRIASIKALLKERDRLFINYLKFREGFLNTEQFSEQVQSLNKLVDESSRKTDSTIQESQKRTLSTTIYNIEEEKKQEPKGFLNKLFGRKKEEPEQKGMNIISEETSVQLDTVDLMEQDSLLKDVSATMKNLEEAQRQKSKQFINREASLANSGDLLINKMLVILREVEASAVRQMEQSNLRATEVVNSGIKRIGWIMLIFVALTLVLLILILKDIAKSKKYQKVVEKARDEAEYHSQAKQRFLSNMSHEIRTPLQSIIGYIEVIRQQLIPDKKYVDAIAHSSRHLMQIVNEVLDYNRIVSGKFSFNPSVFNLEELIEEVIAVMKPQAQNKGIKLYTDIDIEKENSLIKADDFRLKQILYNLLGNAVKFTQSGHVALNLSAKRQKNYLHCMFSVEDTGIGMSKDALKRVFNEFEQADSNASSAAAQKGSGLGLSITKTLVEAQGGRISAKSKPDEGTCFTFYLRFEMATNDEVDQQMERKERSGSSVFGHKVWVVDDDPLILDLFSVILRRNKINFQTFSSAKALLDTPYMEEVKYILTDLRMPEMGGVELCGELKRLVPDDVKIIAITAQVLPEERERVLQSGFDGILIKPFNEDQLLELFGLKADKTMFSMDGSLLEKMAGGDEEQIRLTLSNFERDSRADLQTLEKAMDLGKKDEASLIVHRLAGRTAQIGVKNIAEELKKLELDIESSADLDTELRQKIGEACSHLNDLLDQLLKGSEYS